MDVTGIGEAATAAQKIIGMFFPDKTAEDQAKLAASMALITAQTDIDKAEAQSTDPLQHWRGGLGWVCTFAYGYNFVLQPLMIAVATFANHPVALPVLDIGPLATLTLGMLGLGGLHVAERVKGAA
jgi:hypothetical protein